MDKYGKKYEYIKNFEKLGYGMFVHFGLFSVLGKGEWSRYVCPIDKAEYDNLINEFNPSPDWATNLVSVAKKGGCKYINITTRHHEGFSLFDTKGLSTFDVMHSPAGRDLMREFVDACRAGGIVPFFYHTLLDWHNPDYNTDFPKYIDYLIKSVEILCTEYGEIGGFWFDGWWNKPDADWQFDRLYATIRKYQPNTMIINNTGMYRRGKVGHIEVDSVTFERGNPTLVERPEKPIAREMCQVLNDHWGYAKFDFNYKQLKEFIYNLIDCRYYNSNYLLNVGLRGDGSVREIDRDIFEIMGEWIKQNKDFIYKVKASDIKADGAIVLTDGEYHYAVIKDVPMVAEPDVQLTEGEKKYFTIDAKVKDICWLDDDSPVTLTDKGYYVDTFEYGRSLCVRIAKFSVEK